MRRGDIVQFRAHGARGHEQRGSRYAVVLQASDLDLSTVIVAPTSTAALVTAFRPEVTVRSTRTAVLVEQLRAVDRRRIGTKVGSLNYDELNQIDMALERVLGLTPGGRRR